jgi:hypothetical protein
MVSAREGETIAYEEPYVAVDWAKVFLMEEKRIGLGRVVGS